MRGGGGVSFFAFQDIIMSVTGVILVIALLLALQIDKVQIPTTPAGVSTDEDSILTSTDSLQRLEAQMAELRNQLDQLRAAHSTTTGKNEIEAEISRLEKRVALRLRKKQNLSSSSGPSVDSEEVTKKIAEVARLKFEIDKAKKELMKIGPAAGKRNLRLQELELNVKELEGTLLAAMEKPRELSLIPEKASTTKEPIIVDVSGKRIVAKRFDTAKTEEIASVYRFASYCDRFKTTEHYFVFFFRPSGTNRFEGLRQAAWSAGFEVGYDAIEENTVLKLGK